MQSEMKRKKTIRDRSIERDVDHLMNEESLNFFDVMLKFNQMRFVLNMYLTFFDLKDVRPSEKYTDDKERRNNEEIQPRKCIVTGCNEMNASIRRGHRTECTDIDNDVHIGLIGDLIEDFENSR